jgi:uncharacterized damage-inducible protein DinB
MTQLDEQGRPQPPNAGDEVATVVGFLEFQRATFAWKCGGLDAAGLAATTAASSMTLGGLIKHLVCVEQWWFSQILHGRAPLPPWDEVDWDADRDWEWHTAAQDTPEELDTMLREAVAESRELTRTALADGGLDRLSTGETKSGETFSLRWIMLHMIEEYARHIGHADLIRESVDGLIGE